MLELEVCSIQQSNDRIGLLKIQDLHYMKVLETQILTLAILISYRDQSSSIWHDCNLSV